MTRPFIAPAPRPYISEIQKLTCEYFGISHDDLVGESRLRVMSRPRQIAMYLCCEMTAASTPQIGQRFMGRDHTTVIHARRQIERLLPIDDEVAAAVSTIAACASAYANNRIPAQPETMKVRAA